MQTQQNPQLISYYTLRRIIGILGISFPIVLALGAIIFGDCDCIQKSISIYYHTIMRNIFVGMLSAIGLFLFTYKGYERKDNIAGNLAGIFAFGVAYFPCSVTAPLTSCLPKLIDNGVLFIIHICSAACLFLVLSYFSIKIFTQKDDKPTAMKLKRNKLYRICGYIILGSIAMIALFAILNKFQIWPAVQKLHPTFWFESIALWAFGTSWLVKGRTFLKDK